MRVAYLAAGAGGMICGSCLRDNRLAATLIAQGRDLVLIPLYTPLRTDETDVSRSPVYYGGVNVFLRHRLPLFARLPRRWTRALDAPTVLRGLTRLAGRTRPGVLGALTVSVLEGEHGGQRSALAELIGGLDALQPDLVNLPNLLFAGVAGELKRALGVPIVCTLGGEDLFIDGLSEPFRARAIELIRRGGGAIDGFIATSSYYARVCAERFDLPTERVHVVPMGVAVDAFSATADTEEPFTIGYLARVCPEKGLMNLCEAMIRLHESGRNCRVRAAGFLSRADRPYLRHVRKETRRHGAAAAFEYLGEVSFQQKVDMLRSLHVLSVPTNYHEAKGLYALEAMAAGVPVVQPRHGSFPELIEETGGGLLYDPADPNGLADALARLMDDDALRQALGDRGRQAVRAGFDERIMADRTWALYAAYASGRAVEPPPV